MSQICCNDVNNYSNPNNVVVLPNALTPTFTWLYIEANDEIITGDQSFLVAGDSITGITVKITDTAGANASNSGTAAAPITVDVSGLDNTLKWRIDYTVVTALPDIKTATTFIDPTIKECITASSDCYRKPLPLTTLLPWLTTADATNYYEQSFASLSTWTVTHNSGFARPLSIEVYDVSGARIFTGISNILANSFDIVFSSPRSGDVKVIYKTS